MAGLLRLEKQLGYEELFRKLKKCPHKCIEQTVVGKKIVQNDWALSNGFKVTKTYKVLSFRPPGLANIELQHLSKKAKYLSVTLDSKLLRNENFESSLKAICAFYA